MPVMRRPLTRSTIAGLVWLEVRRERQRAVDGVAREDPGEVRGGVGLRREGGERERGGGEQRQGCITYLFRIEPRGRTLDDLAGADVTAVSPRITPP
jgi:hypothetical protein